MSKTLLATAALAALLATPAHAVTLVQWNFNSTTPDGNTGTGTTMPVLGAGTASLVGGTTASFASGDASGGSSDPATGDDSGWNTTTYAAQGTGSKSRGVQFLVDTTGFTDIVVSWDQRHSNTTSRYVTLQYTTDGSTFIDATVFDADQGGDKWYNGRSFSFNGVAGVENNASFGFRVVASFAPGTSAYVATTAGSNYATSGTQRFDMVTVTAAPIPEPGTVALLLAGLASVGFVARRRSAV